MQTSLRQKCLYKLQSVVAAQLKLLIDLALPIKAYIDGKQPDRGYSQFKIEIVKLNKALKRATEEREILKRPRCTFT